MSLYLDDPIAATASLPQSFEYDAETKTLEITYTDGTRERLFDVPATLHFLLPHHVNPNRVADFLNQRSQYRSVQIPLRRDGDA
jgi:hypothetical protein